MKTALFALTIVSALALAGCKSSRGGQAAPPVFVPTSGR
jgi:nitrous oxide reductase accessory protein NosL